jgi:prepilin-type N-terminal cleavage/methylation domain-containing protein
VRRRPHSRQPGFSLLELVVVLGILTIVMGVAFRLMTQSQVDFDRNTTFAEAHENGDFAVMRVTELVRGAGANPGALSTINSIDFISNKETDTSTPDPRVVRIRSDLNGDGDTDDRVGGGTADADYYMLASEDVTIKFFPDAAAVNGVDVPERTICLVDNTSGAGQGAPRVVAKNITDFSCPVGADPREVTLTISAGPSRPMSAGDPRYASFTRVTQIRLRNRM